MNKRVPIRSRPARSGRSRWRGLLAVAAAGALGMSAQAVNVVEPGHTLKLIADSVNPLDPSQVVLGTNAITGIESITVDENTGLIYVQVIDPIGSCPSFTTGVYEINPFLGGFTAPVNPFTNYGVCERGSDIDIDPATGLLVLQDENGLITGIPEIATLTIPGGLPGLWSTFASFLNSTFGMDFAPGIGVIPAGEVVYVSDGISLNLHSAAFGGAEFPWAPLPGPGDDIYIQPDGDIVFIGESGTPIVTYNPSTFAPTLSPLPPIDVIFINAGLMPNCGTRATVCRNTGEGFITYSCLPGGEGVFRIDEPVTTATLLLTVVPGVEGIHDITVGPPSSGSGGDSLYLTVENFATGAHQVWEVTDVCVEQKYVEPKWTQLPHGIDIVSQTLYASTGNTGAALITVNTSTGLGTFVGPLNMFGPVGDIDCEPLTQTMYGVTSGGTGNLITINYAGPPPLENFIGNNLLVPPGANISLEWVGNTLYGTNTPAPGAPSSLYTINPATGVMTLVGPNDPGGALLLNPIAGLSYDPVAGVMYGSETGGGPSFGGRLVRINLATGAATVVGQITDPLGNAFSNVTALEFDTATGTLYGGTGTIDVLAPGSLIKINPANANASIVGFTGFPGVSGLTFCGELSEGYDIPSDLDWLNLMQAPPGTPGPGPNWVIADDFRSDGRAITCIRWWGSYVDPRFEPGPNQVFSIDSWLLSFHTDLPADQNPDGPWSRPEHLLGLYIAPAAAVTVTPTHIIGVDGHRVYEYVVELKDTCLIHSYPDPRYPDPNRLPAEPKRFCEVQDFIYWLDIQAVVGLTVDPPFCEPINTGTHAFAHFWGWHTSPDAWQDNSAESQIVMPTPVDWRYLQWFPVLPLYGLDRVDQAFELLTPDCPEDCAPPGGDRKVDILDLLALLGAWGQPAPQCCDINCDGNVDILDLLRLLGAWGPC